MNGKLNHGWEQRITRAGADFVYPDTPDIAAAVATRLAGEKKSRPPLPKTRLALAAVMGMSILALVLISSPGARAAIIEFFQIGAVRIWLVEPTLTPERTREAPLSGQIPTQEPLASVLDLSGETTLDEAQKRVGFPLRLPSYPPDLGAPQHVFVQRTNRPLVVLVWTYVDDPERVRMVMYQIGPDTGIEKGGPMVLRETTVHGRPAAWISGIHYLETASRVWGHVRAIGQDVLLWSEEVDEQEITYRLETDLSEAEAVRVAESLR